PRLASQLSCKAWRVSRCACSAQTSLDQSVIEGKWYRIAGHELREIRVRGIDEDVGFGARMNGRHLECQRRTTLQPRAADRPRGAAVGNVIPPGGQRAAQGRDESIRNGGID